MAWDELAKAFVSLLLITDPLGNLPLFMAVTEHCEERQRRKVFTLATFVAFAILLVFALMGAGIFHLFGVTLADLQVAGGLLLLLIAVRIVLAGHWTVEERGEVSVVPLACPLLAGPGAMTAVLVLNASYGLWVTLSALVLTFLVTWGILMAGGGIFLRLGKTGSGIIAQVMALLLATIAVQFIRTGLATLWTMVQKQP
ncbi:MAG: hypothetical protein BDTLLHRC_000138 [Candidatus Fervidibacter sp.]|jgi:multiple antibiotic resistance protein